MIHTKGQEKFAQKKSFETRPKATITTNGCICKKKRERPSMNESNIVQGVPYENGRIFIQHF